MEKELVSAIDPIRGFVKAAMIFHFFESEVFDYLLRSGWARVDAIAEDMKMNKRKLKGFLDYLVNEDLVVRKDKEYLVSKRAIEINKFRGWYTMLIGGYGKTFLQMGSCLPVDADWAARDAAKVGIGSCGISHYDAIPLTRSLVAKAPGNKRNFLDLGCGNAMYLAEFCRAIPEIYALGVEPDRGGYEAGLAIIKKNELESRVSLINMGAIEFINSGFDFNPDFTVLGFVLHEILGQSGRSGVVGFLRAIIDRFPCVKIIVIEVEDRIEEQKIMQHGLSLAYYNPYYLLHYFTEQHLVSDEVWLEIFDEAGLSVLAKETTSPHVDSTALEIGYLLMRKI
ncbi:2-ketoarginine methyltransferase [Burkholderia oklahomensis]|nr:2-ketoarginine methyltransferase [Burkholderia oklahomensis]